MKLRLSPLQSRILLHLAAVRAVSLDALIDTMMPSPRIPDEVREAWDADIRLQVELLTLYGTIAATDTLGIRELRAPDFVRAWARRCAARPAGVRQRPPLIVSTVAATVLLAACSTTQTLQEKPFAPIASYSPWPAPMQRVEQFYSPAARQMVYRYCSGAECPEPTPKVPRGGPRVIEIEEDGRHVPVDQDAAVIASLHNPRAEVIQARPGRGAKPVAGTAGKAPKAEKENAANPLAGSVVASLEAQRLQLVGQGKPAGATPPSTKPGTGATLPAMKAPAGPPPATNMPRFPGADAQGAPATTPSPPQALPNGTSNMPSFPTTGTRVPAAPSAKAPAYQAGIATAVGSVAPSVHVVESAAHGTPATATAGSPEALLAAWADSWSAKDADSYFALYAPDFEPTYGPTRSAAVFTASRRSTMSRPGAIAVSVEVVGIEPQRHGRMSIRFWQSYQSPSFKSRVMKSLELVDVGGEWKIRRERLIPFEPRIA